MNSLVDLVRELGLYPLGHCESSLELCFLHVHLAAGRERTGRWTTVGGPIAAWAELVAVAVGLTTWGCRRQRVNATGTWKADGAGCGY